MIEHGNEAIGIKRKCELLGVARSMMYYQPRPLKSNDATILNEVRSIYQETPFYGYRRILVALRQRGFVINHKRLQGLLALAGIKAVYPTKKTTIRDRGHKVYPYLLRELSIDRPNQVWTVDITYIKVRLGFVYLVCLLDVFSRRIMGWSLSTFLDTQSCLEALENALKHGIPEIINSDQGCQFTSTSWIVQLEGNGIKVSMDGKGRWADNAHVERLWRTIKYENVYLHSFDTVDQARVALRSYVDFYNQKRPHQALNYHTPNLIFALRVVPTRQQLFAQFKLQNQSNPSKVNMTPK